MMLPFITLGSLILPSYALLALVGVAVAILLALQLAPQCGLPRDDVLYAALYGCMGAAVGGKLLYIVTVLPALLRSWGLLVQDWQAALHALLSGGFVFYGGLLGGALAVLYYARRFRLLVLPLLDVFAPALPLFHAFGRVGCLLAGCCYGVPYSGWAAVILAGMQRFPVQLLEAGFNLLLAAGLTLWLRKHPPAGVAIGGYLCIYSIGRFFLEYLRGDAVRGFWFGLSTSQWLGLAVFAVGIVLVLQDFKIKSKKVKLPVDNSIVL